jgi:hypothetical protein
MTTRSWASLAGIGLFTGVIAWALHQQAGYILASWACEKAAVGIWVVGALAIVMLLAGAVLSWCGWRSANVGGLHENAARPRRFLAIVALMASALFLFGLLLQMAGPLFLPGCVG